MLNRRTGSVLTFLLTMLFVSVVGWSQHTFRGGINGVVTDQSGAVVPGALVQITNTATNVTLTTTSTSAGEYAFPELNLGKYDVVVSATGFKTEKVVGVTVSAGQIFTQPVKLAVTSSAETIEVDADAYTLDTTTTTQTTIIDSEAVDNAPLNGRDFTQLATLTPGFANSGAGGYGSLNGTRANQINWQIDGVDNNDIWHNIPAVNQGGVSGIAGIILPIDSVEQFSVQTNASADTGRNPGGTATLGLKGGTNRLHGSAYYFNRNELFGTKSPFTPTKQKVRDYNAGGSLGGPILKDKLFYFANYEQQRFVIGVPQQATEPTSVWQTYATDVVTSNGGTVSPISSGLLTMLWPSYALKSSSTEANKGPQVNNYVSPDPEFGYSYNGVGKIDYTINSKNSISAHWFGGQGNQVAPVGSSLLPYYEVAPIHVQNYQLTYNRTFTPNLTNQIVSGVNYFNQIFNDNKTGFDVTTVGLIDGSPFKNAPKLQISGFDSTGRTPPEGRNDITGQISDNLSWVKGKHQARFGGEFRRVSLNEFYHRNAQGNFKFNGTQGKWTLPAADLALSSDVQNRLLSLADFLAGKVNSSNIALGNPERLVYVHTLAFFAQDSYQLTPKLNINAGLRWDFEGPLHDGKKDLSVFRPSLGGSGIAFQGDQISSVYDPTYTDFSPRIGFSYQATAHAVVRAGVGIYYDTPNINPFLDNRPGNNAPNGLEGNPAGSSPVFTISKNNYSWAVGKDPFGSATTPDCTANPCGVFSVAKKFQPSNNINYNLQVEQSISSNVIVQLGYVGTSGHHLLSIIDLNQSSPNGEGVDQTSRPYYGAFPQYGNINEIQSIGNSNYNSLQATLRASNLHHFSTQLAYTWSHAFDDVTAYRGALPQDSRNFKGDYGQSDFDNRNIFVGEVTYDVPGIGPHKALTGGWQLNSVMAFHSGMPFTVLSDTQSDNTGENNQRANQILANPYAGFKKQAVGADWLNGAAFANPDGGTWGTTHRNAYVAPGFGDVDFSIFKNTKIGERINTQFRVEFYNIFNRTNFAPPLSGASGSYNPNQATISTMQLYDTIGDFNGAPGIGAGEPFNTQLALKVTF